MPAEKGKGQKYHLPETYYQQKKVGDCCFCPEFQNNGKKVKQLTHLYKFGKLGFRK